MRSEVALVANSYSGDSYSRTGYSWTSASQPNPLNPLGNPSIGSDTSSEGYNWVDYLATKYNNSLLYTFDSAISGSTVDQDIIYSKGQDSEASDFPGELASWTAHNRKLAPAWDSDNSLFAVWFGVNDVRIGYDHSDLDDLFKRDIAILFEDLEKLYKTGARQFAVLNLPPLSRTPIVKALSSAGQKQAKTAELLWRSTMKSQLDNFHSTHSEANVDLVDAMGAFDKVLDDPKAYGLPDASCINNDGTSCPWVNDLHPGVVIHEQVAKLVAGQFPAFFKS